MKLLTAEESMQTCVRCGACRNVCPTLNITGREADGPRGRVLMARSLIEGTIPVNQEIKDQLDRCLLCSACVDACPIDVQVPDIVMLAKERIAAAAEAPVQTDIKKTAYPARTFKDYFFDHVLANQKRLNTVGNLLWFYQKSGLQYVTRGLGILKFFPEQMRQMERITPSILPPSGRKHHPEFTPRTDEEKAARGRVAFFHGCIMDVMFRETNDNSIKLLSKTGFDVVTPKAQMCCGALHHHSGKKDRAIELAKANIQAFEEANVDYIITNAGGCGAALAEYADLFRGDYHWLERAKAFSAKIRDISEIIYEKGEMPVTAGRGERVTYQPSCHLQYVMKVKDAPAKLVKGIPNSEYVDLPEKKYCCGSAGIYNLLQPNLANEILDKKMSRVKETESAVLITANPGCYLQMKLGVYREGMEDQIETKHVADYLMESIERAESAGNQ
ncbi:glycolate oxidase iron-sulfur subunit [Cytobacillus firmus]|uniref:Glycolate oxidase iron-sulfur subunit n=2 Tax=Cytobacillus TaxID=2675230 RepID=A0A366K5I7_CYTFI|nr:MULTISPECIES: (Fe-S)-binding protein [Cytobacillus]RBP96552.1 glycolate oxidase iron-sulfur subunit [Cytobacillus firmus]TDX45721.1 glycolate oxidase iron-sulfur subunit [Cytobacillus oceanisediminis]